MGRIAFLLGKPPKPSTMFPEVFRRLDDGALETSVHLPHDEDIDLDHVAGAAVVVHRGLNDAALDLVAKLDGAVPLVNSYAGTLALADRVEMVRALANVPTPPTDVVETWAEVLAVAGSRRVVVKSAGGPGRGVSVVIGTADELADDGAIEPPFLVQDYIENPGVDHKLYVIGGEVRGLTKASPLAAGHTGEGAAFEPPAALVDLARQVGEELGLDFYGVDVLMSPKGPVVVDVNDFPGYRGIAPAARLVADHLTRLVAGAWRDRADGR